MLKMHTCKCNFQTQSPYTNLWNWYRLLKFYITIINEWIILYMCCSFSPFYIFLAPHLSKLNGKIVVDIVLCPNLCAQIIWTDWATIKNTELATFRSTRVSGTTSYVLRGAVHDILSLPLEILLSRFSFQWQCGRWRF